MPTGSPRLKRWPLGLYRVSGQSMQPTYRAGNLLIGWRWFRPRAGQVVVAQTADRKIIKRLVRLDQHGAWLEGDNAAASTDSRIHGAYSLTDIEARIIAKLG